ncbi:MAG: glycosyltransferase [Nanoarchaeota archaeon]|nr:glycosyltransferase [Nanoarchaeota archaeon]
MEATINFIGEQVIRAIDILGEKTIFLFGIMVQSFKELEAYNRLVAVLLTAIITIGAVNWTIWLIRRTRAIFYKPFKGEYNATTSVIVPIYKEKEHILIETVDSILKNNPTEVILILDETEKKSMELIKTKYGRNSKVQAYFVDVPGKRPSLAEGMKKAKGEIVVLVDSDTQWIGENFLKKLLIPFQDPKVGGVGTRQRVRERNTWARVMIDWILDIKYSNFIPSDSLSGSVLCLSGRTAAYRREAVIPQLPRLVNDYFLWHKSLGGDDARLTTLVLQQGYRTVYQDNCIAESDFDPRISVYLKQKIRWSRNSFRTYLKSIFSFWPWKQRRFYYLMSAYHTIVPGLTIVLSLFVLLNLILLQMYAFSVIWIIWAFISRGIKNYTHLRKRPSDIYLFPVIVFYYYILSFIKVYAFFTLTKESWAGSRKGYKIKKGNRV